MKRATIIVKGDVQSVGYREKVRKIARKCNITGNVRNLHPYDVQVVAEGEEQDLKTFIDTIRIQKPPVVVEELNVSYGEPTGEFGHMEIIRGDWEEEQAERLDNGVNLLHGIQDNTEESIRIGNEMLGKQDQMLGKQDQMLDKQDQMLGKQDQMLDKEDQMLDKQDQMLGKQDQMLGKQDQMLGKQDTTIGGIEGLRGDMGQRFDVLDDKYGAISKNLVRIIERMEVSFQASDRDRETYQKNMDRLMNTLIEALNRRNLVSG